MQTTTSWDEEDSYTSESETTVILNDPETMAAIEEGQTPAWCAPDTSQRHFLDLITRIDNTTS